MQDKILRKFDKKDKKDLRYNRSTQQEEFRSSIFLNFIDCQEQQDKIHRKKYKRAQ